MVLDFFRRRRLSDDGQKRLAVALARAEAAIVQAHVENAVDVIEAMSDEMPLDRALEVYLEALEENDQRAEIIARRVLTRLGVESCRVSAAQVPARPAVLRATASPCAYRVVALASPRLESDRRSASGRTSLPASCEDNDRAASDTVRTFGRISGRDRS